MANRPTREELLKWYYEERISPREIAKRYSVHERTMRGWMHDVGIKLLGSSFLRKGKPALWNAGKIKTPETIEKMRAKLIGRVPPNKGCGSVRFNCPICGTEVFDKPYRRKHTCSNKCRLEWQRQLRGEKHWNYVGSDHREQRKRLWSDLREWRTKIIARDEHCIVCSTKEKLIAHHLNNFSEFPDKRLDLNNGITMCHTCHWRFHRETSHKHATKEMFEMWLKMLKEKP